MLCERRLGWLYSLILVWFIILVYIFLGRSSSNWVVSVRLSSLAGIRSLIIFAWLWKSLSCFISYSHILIRPKIRIRISSLNLFFIFQIPFIILFFFLIIFGFAWLQVVHRGFITNLHAGNDHGIFNLTARSEVGKNSLNWQHLVVAVDVRIKI